ncbi:hypothetical protein [Celeribacter sp.]|uniref:hypothetical protein n=1 Tax=Celeribacter sp. TaxID=1890673 RepID=UPI003A92B545
MASKYLLISRYTFKTGAAIPPRFIDDATTRNFWSDEQNELMQLRAFEGLSELPDTLTKCGSELSQATPGLIGDVRRELVELVEQVKRAEDALPQTPYVQLRHVEVVPERMAEYRKWREETIFDVVRSHDEIESFSAYHSLISGVPGVMFVSGFSCPSEAYAAVFNSERYKTIVQQAGDGYITGGTDGLYTRIYNGLASLAA